jgi:hypothetical protein
MNMKPIVLAPLDLAIFCPPRIPGVKWTQHGKFFVNFLNYGACTASPGTRFTLEKETVGKDQYTGCLFCRDLEHGSFIA